VSEDGKQAADDAQNLLLRRPVGEGVQAQIRQPLASRVTFQRIDDEDKDPSWFAQGAEHIGRSYVSAAHASDVDSPGFGQQKASRDGPDQVSRNCGGDVA